MPRSTTQRKSTRARTGNTLRDNPTGLIVDAPLVDTSGGAAGRAAESLSNLAREGTQFAGQVIADKRRAGFEQAQEDFTKGIVDQDKLEKNRGYLAGREQLRAAADWARLMPQFEDELRQLDTDNMSEDELNATLDEMFKREFGGVEQEPFYAAAIADQLLAFQLRKIGEHKVNALAEAREQEEADLSVTLQNDYAINGAFNYSRLMAEANRMRDGAERDELVFAQVVNAANAALDETIIDNLPDKRPDGSNSIKHVPAWQAKLNTASNTVMQRRIAAESAERAEIIRGQKEEAKQFALGIAVEVLLEDGVMTDELFFEYASMPGADASTVSAMDSFRRSVRNDAEERSGNFDIQSDLLADMFTGDGELSDVFNARTLGFLGSGKAGRDNTNRLINAWQEQQSLQSRDDNTEITRLARNLNDRYNPKIAGELMPLDVGRATIRIQANMEFHDRLRNGDDIYEAHQAVVTKYDDRLDKVGGVYQAQGSVSKLGRESKVAAATVIQAVDAEDPTDMIRNGIGYEQLQNLFDTNQITEEQAAAAGTMLLNLD